VRADVLKTLSIQRSALHYVVAVMLTIGLFTNVYARIISETEPNDSFASATVIECGDTVQCADLALLQSDFYRMNVPGGDSVYFTTFPCQTDVNTTIILYDSLYQLIDLNLDSGVGSYSMLGVFAQFNQTCYLQVFMTQGTPGDYSLSFVCQTQSNSGHATCAEARPVTFWPYYNESTTLGAGNEMGTPAPDVYYTFTPPTAGDFLVRVCSGSFDSRAQLFGFCTGDLMDDASDGTCQLGADLYLFGLTTRTYFLVVEGTSANQFGEFTLEIDAVFQECPVPQNLLLFTVAGLPFLDWQDVPEADYYLVEQSTSALGPYEALATTTQTFWQDNTGYALNARFYRVRSVCQ